MKKDFVFSTLLLSSLLAIGGCQAKKNTETFTLEAENLPIEINGHHAYIINTLKESVDSVMITDGGFVYTANADVKNIHGIKIDNEIVVNELIFQGNGKLVYEDSIGYCIDWAPVDKSEENLNFALRAFRTALEEKVAPLARQVKNLGYDRLRAREDQKEVDRISLQIDSVLHLMRSAFKAVTDDFYSAHSQDAVAIAVFREIGFKDEADFVNKYNAAPAVVKEDPLLTKRFKDFSFILETSVGKKYKDFEMDDTEGQVRRLSEYMSEGQYLLVDFWASWCGPCRKGMPHLAALHKKYGAKGLRVLSIGMGEESKADYDKAVKEIGIVWDSFYDGKGAGGDTYGFPSIPTILLISPDGTILVRSSNPSDVDNVLEEALGH
ncbi:MAG: TlpA disulfide reductase family protein [Bacteroides sp.]|nr:TlpA disulfide reductase family protein [Bacteroides sp.]